MLYSLYCSTAPITAVLFESPCKVCTLAIPPGHSAGSTRSCNTFELLGPRSLPVHIQVDECMMLCSPCFEPPHIWDNVSAGHITLYLGKTFGGRERTILHSPPRDVTLLAPLPIKIKILCIHLSHPWATSNRILLDFFTTEGSSMNAGNLRDSSALINVGRTPVPRDSRPAEERTLATWAGTTRPWHPLRPAPAAPGGRRRPAPRGPHRRALDACVAGIRGRELPRRVASRLCRRPRRRSQCAPGSDTTQAFSPVHTHHAAPNKKNGIRGNPRGFCKNRGQPEPRSHALEQRQVTATVRLVAGHCPVSLSPLP